MNSSDSASQETGAMVTTIILALGVLTAVLVVGVFIVALMELNEIDNIGESTRAPEFRHPASAR